jgi:hypothetical protein
MASSYHWLGPGRTWPGPGRRWLAAAASANSLAARRKAMSGAQWRSIWWGSLPQAWRRFVKRVVRTPGETNAPPGKGSSWSARGCGGSRDRRCSRGAGRWEGRRPGRGGGRRARRGWRRGWRHGDARYEEAVHRGAILRSIISRVRARVQPVGGRGALIGVGIAEVAGRLRYSVGRSPGRSGGTGRRDSLKHC